MRQIRARIREKRGVDYTEEEIRELANVKLEKFLDPSASAPTCSSSSGARTAARPPRTSRSRTRRSSKVAPPVWLHPQAAEAAPQAVLQPNPAIRRSTSSRSSTNARSSATSSTALIRSHSQPRARDDAAGHRGQEPEDARRVDVEPPRFRRAPRPCARRGRAIDRVPCRRCSRLIGTRVPIRAGATGSRGPRPERRRRRGAGGGDADRGRIRVGFTSVLEPSAVRRVDADVRHG